MRTLEAACYKQEDWSLVYTSDLYVTNIFDRVDGTADICQQFKVKCASNDFGQQRQAETRRGCLKPFPKKLALPNLFAHFMQRVVYTSNVSYVTAQFYLSNKS